jgi:predicted permease
VIVTAQIALSLVLLVAASLFAQTLRNLRGVDTGFDTREIITFEIESPAGAAWDEFRRTGLERLAGMPGAAAVTVYGAYGLLGGSPVHSEIVAEGTGGSDEVETASRVIVGPGFFETMGIRLVSGREFTDADMGWARSSWVVILSESLADVLFPGESAVGRTLHFRMGDDGAFSDARVVGVAGDAKHGTVREEESATLYLPHNLGAGGAPTGTRFAVRTEGDAARLGATIRGVVETFDDSFFLADMRTLHEVMEASIVGERFVGQLMAILGVVALLLASLGIYGVLSSVVTQRTQEIGVRMALGAQTGQILRMLMREMTGAVSIGIVVGLCVLIMTTRAVSVILFGLTPTDPSTIAVAVLVLASAAGVASYVPARRASRADPLRALRQE